MKVRRILVEVFRRLLFVRLGDVLPLCVRACPGVRGVPERAAVFAVDGGFSFLWLRVLRGNTDHHRP